MQDLYKWDKETTILISFLEKTVVSNSENFRAKEIYFKRD